MHANNEVGTLNPIADVAVALKEYARENGLAPILLHTDASQSVGKVPVDVDALGVDLLTVAGHKLYAPKGIGALYIRAGTPPPTVLIHGAGHESGRRAGTENVAFDVALGEACAMVREHFAEYAAHMRASREFLLEQLTARLASPSTRSVQFRVNGHPEHALPNTLSISFSGLSAVKLLACTSKWSGFAANVGS